MEGKHLGLVIGTGLSGMDRPFLIPFTEGTISHMQGVHFLDRLKSAVNGDKVVFEGSGEVLPGAKVRGSKSQSSFLAFLGPFISSGAKFEVCQGCSDFFIDTGVYVCI